MIVLTPQDIDMHRAPGCDSERIKDVREHLRREVTNLLALETEICHTVWPRTDIDDRPR
jgi:hypothetical protein